MAEKYVPPVQVRGLRGNIVKPKNFKGTLLRLWNMIKGESKGLIPVFFLAAIASGTAMLTPLLTGKIVDSIEQNQLALQLLLLLLLVYLGDTLVKYIQGYLMAGVSQKMIRFIRKTLFGKLNQLPLRFFDTRLHGDLMSRLTNDIDNISSTISDSLIHLITLLFTLVGVFVIMISLNVWLTLAVFVTSPLIFLLTKMITKRTRVLYKKQQATLGALNGHIEETISGMSVVKAYCKEEDVIKDFEKVNDALCQVGKKSLIWSGFLMPIMNVINNLCFINVAVTGGLMAAAGLISVGIISSFLLYSRQFTRPLNDIANIYNTLQTAVAGAERIFEIFDEQGEPPDKADALSLTQPRGDIAFEKVYFGYDEETMVLKGVDLDVKAGTKVAIVGSTGAGKTTIISLLARFYDVSGGRILLDGVDLRDYKLHDLRSCFGIVLQDSALFQLSVMDNIRYGRENATDQEVIEAAVAADADSFIRRLPQGYQTVMGDGGNSLSQGEKQLLTIARAMLADAPILILDEATSNVDTHTEQKIRDAMLQLTNGRTSFIIAHRLSTIRNCDHIVVIEDGKVVEQGTHMQLLEQNGIYNRMYQTQMNG